MPLAMKQQLNAMDLDDLIAMLYTDDSIWIHVLLRCPSEQLCVRTHAPE